MMTIIGATQRGFGLLLLDTGTAEGKGQFLATAHGQDRVEQTSRGKNVHGSDAKIRPQELVDGLCDDLRVTNGIGAVLVHLWVKRGDIHIPHIFTLPSHGMQSDRACSPPRKASRGSMGATRSKELKKRWTTSSASTKLSHSHSHCSITV